MGWFKKKEPKAPEPDLLAPIRALIDEYAGREAERRPCTREQFMALLAGVPALRKTPGIPGPGEVGEGYFTTLPQCADEEAGTACRAHLEKVFGITGRDSLVSFCKEELICDHQYRDFLGFWEGQPPFPLEALHDDGPRQWFLSLKDFSAPFHPLLQDRGYLAWDAGECLGHLRLGYACGLLSPRELSELADHWLTSVQRFGSWTEYAVSTVCGYLYWDFRQGAKPETLQQGLELWLKLVRRLLDDPNAWGSGLWYTPTKSVER